jgi:hypothetical protein
VGSGRGRTIQADFGSIGAAVDAELSKHVPSVGFRSALSSHGAQTSHARSVTYVLTNSVPADLAALEAAPDTTGHRCHIVAVTSERAWDLLGGTRLASTVIEPKPDLDLRTQLVEDPALLRRVIASLTESLDGNAFHGERIGR